MKLGILTRPRVLTTVVAVVAALGWVSLPESASADTAPPAGTPATVSADALPTWQVNGVVWSQAVVGNNVFAGGSFTTARPAGVAAGGAGQVAQNNFIAYDITTGNRVAALSHSVNGQVLTVQKSPDGSRIYIGGDFTTVDGTARNHIAAFNATTGALITTFHPSISGQVGDIAATNTTVYAGGSFGSAGGASRTRLAAFNASDGALLPWAPKADDFKVKALVMTPDSSKVVVGGSFTTLNGVPASGMGAVDATTGATLPWAANTKITDGGKDCGINSLSADGNQIYGSGFAFGCGNFEGAFALNPTTGAINWANDCHGDTYDTAPVGSVLYTVSHAHNCSTIGGFFQSDPWATNMRHALAFTTYPTGTNTGPDDYGWDYNGVPSSQLLQWYPDVATGSFTGQTQAAWSVSGNSNYVVLGGEFPKVNGGAQQGLVRFAVKNIATNKRGPVKAPGAPTPSANSFSAGTARVAWQSAYDMDNASLTYQVFRSGTAAAVYTKTQDSNYWNYPMMGFIDNGVTSGQSYTYTIKVTDPSGNVLTLPKTNSVTISNTAQSDYAKDVLGDGATDFWRFGEDSGSAVYDYAGFNDATASTGVTRGADGAITGDSDKASTFNGAADGIAYTNSTQATTPSFTIESWIKTTSTSGGKIVGYGGSQNTDSGSYDRHVYMDNDGHVFFGVYPGGVRTVRSAAAYNDGNYHHIVATLSSTTGMALYIDGKKVGSDANTKSAQDYTGYWRIGGDNINGWDNQPASNKIAGTIDDVAIYPSALSLTQVQKHYADSGRTINGAAPKPTDAYGKAVYDDNPDLYWRLDEASGSKALDSGPNGESGNYFGGVTKGEAGAVAGTSDTAAGFDGASGGVSSEDTVTNPTVYTEELWFKTTTHSGGKLIGFGTKQANEMSDGYDRHVYMEDSGQLTFGTWTGETNTVTSADAYNDGSWHYLVARQDGNGLALFVDGQSVGTNPQTQAQDYTGFWRIGGDNAWGGSSPWFNGTLDEVAVYSKSLSASDIASHYSLGKGNGPANQDPDAAFTKSVNGLDASFDATDSMDPDGDTPLSYAWNFGDGATDTGKTTSHHYAAGTYTVTLTVTDGHGGTDTATDTVTATAPAANQDPNAAFTKSVNGLDASFDATDSMDPDGDTPLSYAWNFGDGATDTGKTTSHHYAAGNYTVTLTVTDGHGGTGTATDTVTATAPAGPTLIATDDFGRTASSGWGSADQGGAWTVTGTKANYKVAGGVGTMTIPTAGTTRSATLNSVSSRDQDLQITATPQKLATGGGSYLTLIGRQIGAVSYRSSLVLKSDGTATLGISKIDGSEVRISPRITVPGFTYAAGDKINMRFQMIGASPTTLKAKVWKAGATEPTTWTVTGTDSTAALQAAGAVGVASYLSGSSTNAPSDFVFDALRLYDGDH